jgi:hypothetical protein
MAESEGVGASKRQETFMGLGLVLQQCVVGRPVITLETLVPETCHLKPRAQDKRVSVFRFAGKFECRAASVESQVTWDFSPRHPVPDTRSYCPRCARAARSGALDI